MGSLNKILVAHTHNLRTSGNRAPNRQQPCIYFSTARQYYTVSVKECSQDFNSLEFNIHIFLIRMYIV